MATKKDIQIVFKPDLEKTEVEIVVLNPDCNVIQPAIEIYTGVRKWFKKEFETTDPNRPELGTLRPDVVGLFSKPKVCTIHKANEDGTIINATFVVSNTSGNDEIGKELNKLLKENFLDLVAKFEITLKEFFISEFHERYVEMGDTLLADYNGLFDEFLEAEGLRKKGRKKPQKPPVTKYDEPATESDR